MRFLILTALSLPLAAQQLPRVRLLDGQTLSGRLTGVTSAGDLRLATEQGNQVVPVNLILAVDLRREHFVPSRAPVRLDLVSGDVLLGAIDDGRLDEISLTCPALGPLKLQLDHIKRVILRKHLTADMVLPDQTPREDEVFLRSGRGLDRIRGEVVRLGRASVVLDTAEQSGRKFLFQQASVVAVRLAPLETWKPPSGILCIARCSDGSAVTGRLVASGGGGLALKLLVGATVSLNRELLERLEFRNPVCARLSDLKPAAVDEQPFLEGAAPHSLLRDRGFAGQPRLRIGEREFSRGLGLVARTRVSYTLEGRYDRFEAWVGADPSTRDRPLPGSVRVRVLVDHKLRWTSPLLMAGAAPERVALSGLRGTRLLTIELGFGDSLGVGARGVLGDPVVIR